MAALLNRGWRLIGTALGFTLFGVGGLLLSLFWFPLLALCLRGERRRTLAQLTIRHSFRLFLGVLRGWGVLDYRVSGMPAHLRGALVVANHPSLLDYVMLAAEMPVCDCIVKQSLWRNPFIGGVVRAADYLPNVAGEDLLALCQGRIGPAACCWCSRKEPAPPRANPSSCSAARPSWQCAARCRCNWCGSTAAPDFSPSRTNGSRSRKISRFSP